MMSARRIRIEKDQRVSADDVEEKMDLINTLDYDLLAQIFMLLPISERITMDQVCFKWKEACQQAWHDIKKYECRDTIVRGYEKCILTQSHVEKILFYCGKFLKELILSKACDSSIMPVVAKYCKNLTTLEFEIVMNKDDSYFDRSVEAFTHLKQLKVVKIHIFGRKIKFQFQFQILDSLPKDMNEIHLFFRLNECPLNAVSSLFSLKEFTNLRKLTIHSCIITNIIQEISKKTTLVYLDLQDCETEKEIFTFNQLSNLEHLNIKDVSFTSSQANWQFIPNPLSGIFNACKNLKHLDAPDFHVDLAEIEMENWVNLRNLVYLNICWRASDTIPKKFINYCNNLEFINISRLDSKSIIELSKLKNLNYLEFRYFDKIKEEVMVAILNNYKKLKHLKIPCENELKAYIFDDLSKLQYIEYLDLTFSYELKDYTIYVIAKNCKLLKFLSIDGCDVTFTALLHLTSLKHLEDLNVRWIDDVEDRFIVELRGIKSLNCGQCKKLTDAGVKKFIKNNPDLEYLDISGNEQITIKTIIAAEKVSKNRTNDAFLSINTCDPVLKRACIESQWLINANF